MSRIEDFPELISEHLNKKIEALLKEGRELDASRLQVQYKYNENEEDIVRTATNRHYEADIGGSLAHVERLYKNHCCIEINFVCKAHCRHCLRSNYDKWTITNEEVRQIAKYVSDENLTEVLITGGDPFLTPSILLDLCQELKKNCKKLRIIRIGTRVITQDPMLICDNKNNIVDCLKRICEMFYRVEVATQINTWVELDDSDVASAIDVLHDLGITLYSQNVFLKGVNDTPSELIKLYEYMRYYAIEPHYLFHCCDIKGAAHLRTSVHDMVRCYEKLVNSGAISGRCKPMMALMTCIGKVIITDLNAIEYKGDSIILRSTYKYSERLAYNPEWKLPEDAWVDKDGYLWCEYRGEALQIRQED